VVPIPGPEPDVRIGDDDGTVVVSVRLAASADEAWRAVTQGARLAAWLGDLSAPELAPRATARLSFGDGDFFDIDAIEVDPSSRRVRWRWRFLGCGVREDIAIEVVPGPGAMSTATVRDSEPRRGRDASLALGEGWRDFLSRLQRHLATGERTRYDWREEVDVWVELPASADDASRTLIAAAGDWLPLDRGDNLFEADALVVGDDPAGRLAIADVQPAGPRAVRFAARPEGLRRATSCEISIQPLGDDAVLAINQLGFRDLDAPDAERRRYRERCLDAWLDAARRAASIMASREPLHATTSAAAPGAS